jgi:hypothetical protein
MKPEIVPVLDLVKAGKSRPLIHFDKRQWGRLVEQAEKGSMPTARPLLALALLPVPDGGGMLGAPQCLGSEGSVCFPRGRPHGDDLFEFGCTCRPTPPDFQRGTCSLAFRIRPFGILCQSSRCFLGCRLVLQQGTAGQAGVLACVCGS